MIMPNRDKEYNIADYVLKNQNEKEDKTSTLSYILDVMVQGAQGDNNEIRNVYTAVIEQLSSVKDVASLMELSKHARIHGCYTHAHIAASYAKDYVIESQERAAKQEYPIERVQRRRKKDHRSSVRQYGNGAAAELP